ncbi:MAG TPA: RecQ family zinc-binding domain-containing protein [Polyangiaceae bacterium]|nr:RecQ family zinc-binding domain-containing protein [Polyangiaceae bacterium]
MARQRKPIKGRKPTRQPRPAAKVKASKPKLARPAARSAKKKTTKKATSNGRARRPPAELQRPTLIPTLPPPPRSLPREAPKAASFQQIDECARRLGIALPDPELRRAIAAALSGADALAVTPDFEAVKLAALSCAEQIGEPTLLISPVASELRAMVDRNAGGGVALVRLDAKLPAAERGRVLSRLEKGGPLLVLLGPGELNKLDFSRACARSGIGLVIVDEAHVLASFTHELRPSLSGLVDKLQPWGRPPLLAMTRPVPSALRRDIAEALKLRRPLLAEGGPIRDNVVLSSHIARGEERQSRLIELVRRLSPPGIVYCAQPHDVDAVYACLASLQLDVHRHHSGLPPDERTSELAAWSAPERRAIMVATSGFSTPSGALGLSEEEDATAAGFGRALERRDVRFVIHHQAPPSLEQYVREIGCAGADGEPAHAVLLYDSAHSSFNDALLAQQRFRPQHLEDLTRALQAASLENRPLTIEALALSSGHSRRTMDRMTALAADAGLIEKVAGWVRSSTPSTELALACRRLVARLVELRNQDGRRLDAVAEYAEAPGCRTVALFRYFGCERSRCGRCSHCAPVHEQRAATGAYPVRRPAAQSFSVGPPAQRYAVQAHADRSPDLTARLADRAAR